MQKRIRTIVFIIVVSNILIGYLSNIKNVIANNLTKEEETLVSLTSKFIRLAKENKLPAVNQKTFNSKHGEFSSFKITKELSMLEPISKIDFIKEKYFNYIETEILYMVRFKFSDSDIELLYIFKYDESNKDWIYLKSFKKINIWREIDS